MREIIMSAATLDMQVFYLFSIGLALSSFGILELLSRKQHCARNSLLAWIITWSVMAMIRPDKIGFSIGFACLGVSIFLLFTNTTLLTGLGSLFQNLAVRRCKQVFLTIAGIVVVVATLNYIDLRESEEDHRQFAERELTLRRLNYVPKLEVVSVLRTERGNTITLKKRAEDRDPSETKIDEELYFKVHSQWGAKLIQTEQASDECNCHGWVFAKGQFWIDSQDVETIVQGGNYRRVTMPITGDLAIYRDENGQILHSAIVRGRANNDVLVEGKWGPLGVYIHHAKYCGYGEQIEYYHHRFRRSHVLAGLESCEKSSKLPQSAIKSLEPAPPIEP